ncbi:hypothetical protein LTR36_010992 [Oleoguttula mirabilis]|uniref:DUF1753-domain-containing protein n=1 Tax=Oleoguttula mirabilis TaxID=1507867 RepID=A0AAV9J3Y3_9PEZI|nr:hypothetical protein LTR36_010992 [Oleoguttula mirabilis]
MPSILHFPRPRTFLHLISLRTATEFIAFTLAINKVTGLYGILALLTGYHLNPLQLSHYIYSLAVLALVCYLSPAIRQRDGDGVLKTLALAWLYVLDSVVNSVYTSLFGTGWFLILAQHLNEGTPVTGGVPGAGTMNATAGFTSPEHSVSQVDVIAAPGSGVLAGQEAVAFASGDGSGGTLGSVLFERGSIASIMVLGLLWLIRIYFCIIVLSFARSTVRQYIASTSTSTTATGSGYTQTDDPTMAESPFRAGGAREEGAGWRGGLGRLMLRFPSRRYWLGRDESEEEWVRATEGRFGGGGGGRGLRVKVPTGESVASGVGERERRARSGTGPPVPLVVGSKGMVPQ